MQLPGLTAVSFYLLFSLYEGCNKVWYVTSSKQKKNTAILAFSSPIHQRVQRRRTSRWCCPNNGFFSLIVLKEGKRFSLRSFFPWICCIREKHISDKTQKEKCCYLLFLIMQTEFGNKESDSQAEIDITFIVNEKHQGDEHSPDSSIIRMFLQDVWHFPVQTRDTNAVYSSQDSAIKNTA